MPATLPLVLLCIVGLVLIARSQRVNRIEATAGTGAEPVRHRIHASAQFGRIGAPTLTEPIRTMANVAPSGTTSVALDVEGIDGGLLTRITADQVVMARGWARGHLVLSFGEMRPAYGRPAPVPATDSGWEIHLVDVAGHVLRLRGMSGGAMVDDLLRLHHRVRGALHAHAA